MQLILIFLFFFLGIKTNAFDRLLIKEWLDPKSFTSQNYFGVYGSGDNPDYVNCAPDKFFGPFKSNTMIVKSDLDLDPHNRFFGEFILVLFDVKNSNTLPQSSIKIKIEPDDDENEAEITQLKKLSGNVNCFGQTKTNQAYFVNFTLPHTDSGYFADYQFTIQVELTGGIASKWGIRKLLVKGGYCNSDCLACNNNVEICTNCDSNLYLSQGKCKCNPGYQIFSLSPTKCLQPQKDLMPMNICHLEIVQYLRKTFISSQCEILPIMGQDYLVCEVSTTNGFPIRPSCADQGLYQLCINNTATYTCYDQHNTGDVRMFTNNMQSTFSIPTSQLSLYSFNSTIYQPNTLISNFNFTLGYNTKSNPSNFPKINFLNHTWETVLMQKTLQSPVIFDLYKYQGSDTEFVPLIYICTDQTCLVERQIKKFVDKQWIYFRVYANYFLENAEIEVIEFKMISTAENKIWDLQGSMVAVVKKDFDSIYKVQVDFSKTSRRALLDQMDYDLKTDNARAFIKVGLVEQVSLFMSDQIGFLENNEQSQRRILPVGDLWDPMDSDFGMNLV